MNRFKLFLFPFIKPLLPIVYYPRYLKLRKQINACFFPSTDIFCFFPAYHTGGAENVHLQILKALDGYRKITVINYKSRSQVHKEQFKQLSDCFIDLHAVGNHLFFQKKIAKLLADKLNKLKHKCTIFGCNSILFYQILPLLTNPLIKKVDLLHAFSPYQDDAIETKSIKYVSLIDKRIVINERTRKDYQLQYETNGIDFEYLNRIEIIHNAIDAKCIRKEKSFNLPLKCLFVGRGSVEKRFHLFIRIAEESSRIHLPLIFTAVGNVENYLPESISPNLKILGEIQDRNKLQQIYDDHHLLLTTSSFEGFPMTIVEAMCNGLINLSTDVGGISEHIIPGKTGFLIPNKDEISIVNFFIDFLSRIISHQYNLQEISSNSIEYAIETFNPETFYVKYRHALINQ